MKTFFRVLLLVAMALIGALVIGTGIGFLRGPSAIKRVNAPDAHLRAAIAQAKAALPQFISELNHPADGQRFAVMASFESSMGNEYLWIKDPTYSPGTFKGILDQIPVAANHRKGDRVSVKQVDVVDWMVRDADGSMHGRYTEQP